MSHRPLFGLLLLLMFGCGGYKPVALGACGDGVPLDEEDCAGENFVAADRCFGNRESACDCMGCAGTACKISDDTPAKVTCGAK